MVGPAGARGPCRRPRAAAARVGGARPPLRPAAAGGRRPGRRGGPPGPRRAAGPRVVVVRASGEFDGSDLYVPSDVLGGPAPEEKAANALVNLFTFIAVKIVDFMHEHPLVDGNEWLGLLMQHEDYDMRAIGLRILETRELYTNDVFDFEEMNLKAMASMQRANKDLKAQILLNMMAESPSSELGLGGDADGD